MNSFILSLQQMGFTGVQELSDVGERRYHKARADNRRWVVTVGGTTSNSVWLFSPTGQYLQNTGV